MYSQKTYQSCSAEQLNVSICIIISRQQEDRNEQDLLERTCKLIIMKCGWQTCVIAVYIMYLHLFIMHYLILA